MNAAIAALAAIAVRPDWTCLDEVDVPVRQGALSHAIDEALYQNLLSTAPTIRSCALALSSGLPRAGDWLNVVPSSPLGLPGLWRTSCCSCTASDCLTCIFADSSDNLASISILCDNAVLRIPTTMRSLIISSLKGFVLAALSEGVESGDEPVGGLLGELATTVEACTLKYYILVDVEKRVEGTDDGVVLLAVAPLFFHTASKVTCLQTISCTCTCVTYYTFGGGGLFRVWIQNWGKVSSRNL